MSSTDAATERALRQFHQTRISPAAEAARARGVDFLDSRETIASDSFFTRCERPASLFVALDATACEAAVREAWQRDGLGELASIAGELFALAPSLAPAPDAEQDISPFVYVMF